MKFLLELAFIVLAKFKNHKDDKQPHSPGNWGYLWLQRRELTNLKQRAWMFLDILSLSLPNLKGNKVSMSISTQVQRLPKVISKEQNFSNKNIYSLQRACLYSLAYNLIFRGGTCEERSINQKVMSCSSQALKSYVR